MPPSWLRALADHQVSIPPELEDGDWSRGLGIGNNATLSFSEGLLSASNIALQGEVCAFAVEPILGYFAVGTSKGSIHLFGRPSVQISWTLRPANKVRHLLFKSGSPLLVAIDDRDNLSVYDLSRNDPQVRAKTSASNNPFVPSQSTTVGSGPSNPVHPDTPMRIAAHSARNSVICVEVSPLYDHLFLGLRDGTIDTFDLDRLSPSPYRVPNLWWEEEEILRKSGVPDAPNRRHVPLIIEIKTHPKDINQLLLAYEGGVILLDIREKTVLKTYQLRHLPGAVGSGVGNPDSIWTERSSPATCIAWRPDGLIFACGHEDGCISFWDVQDDSKPVMVRTLELCDVDKPVGIPDEIEGGPAQSREPIFKLAWSGFPEQSWLDMAANATSKVQQQQYQQSHNSQQELTSGSILTVLGGATERHPPGLVCLHLPPFALPYSSYWSSKTPEAMSKARQALRASLETNLETRYSTRSAVEDFYLIPKSNPYYNLAYDPMAVIILQSPDPLLPPLPPPAAGKGLTAFAFPPPSHLNSVQSAAIAKPGFQAQFAQEKLNLPLSLSTAGSGAILGSKVVEVSVHSYRKLAGKRDVGGTHNNFSAGSEAVMEAGSSQDIENDLKLRGGLASPTVVGITRNSEKQEAIKSMVRGEKMRILITWHLDGTVRFHDASPQLLLIGAAEDASRSKDSLQQRRGTQESTPSDKPIFLEKAFPSPLPHLTINIRSLVQNRSMVGHPIFERLNANLTQLQIARVDFAPEALEVVITLRSGQVFHYRFGYARYSHTEELQEAVADEVLQDEVAAAELVNHPKSPSSPSSPSLHIQQHRQSMSHLDGAMAGAMRDLDVGPSSNSSGTPPPPRPKRDPKRLSAARKLGFGRSNKEEEEDAAQSSIVASPALAPPHTHEHSSSSSSTTPRMLSSSSSTTYSHSMPVDEITEIQHMASWDSDGFKPNVLIELQRGEITTISISDVGFLAIACGLALAVVDLRGPELVIREGFGDGAPDLTRVSSKDRREEKRIIEEENKSAIRQVKFSICRTVDQPVLSPTLIVIRENGYVSTWSFTKSSLDLWICERSHGSKIDDLTRAISLDVLDIAGNICTAVPAELQRSLREQNRGMSEWQQQSQGGGGSVAASDVNLLFAVTPRSLSLRVGLTGPRLAKAEIEEDVQGACIVDRHGEKVCLALCSTSILLYSLPHLKLITRLQRHNRNREERLSIQKVQVSFDASGDFVEVFNSLDVQMWTIFATMPRPGPPSLLLFQPPSMPMAPNALNNVASSVVNWIGGKSSALTSGAQFDEFLAGSKRPAPPKLPEQKFIEVRVLRQQAAAAAAAATTTTTSSTTTRTTTASSSGGGNIGLEGGNSSSRSSIPMQSQHSADLPFARKKEERKQAVRDTHEAAGQASWNIDLAKQRGEMMSSLEEGLSSLERGAKGWMQSAKEDMIKQTAKDRISKYF